MTATAILSQLAAQGLHLTRRGSSIVISPRQAATPEAVDLIRANKSGLLAVLPDDSEVEARHIRLIAMLRDNPTIKYAVFADGDADPDAVIVAVAVRGLATCEVRIPKGQFDAFQLLDLVGKYSGTLH